MERYEELHAVGILARTAVDSLEEVLLLVGWGKKMKKMKVKMTAVCDVLIREWHLPS